MDNSITVPWKAKINSNNEGGSSSKSALEKRIALVQQNLTTQPPSSTKPSTLDKRRHKTNTMKIADISKSLLSPNQQNDNDQQNDDDQQDEETNNSDAFITNEDIVEDIEESNNTITKISSGTRNAKKRKAK